MMHVLAVGLVFAAAAHAAAVVTLLIEHRGGRLSRLAHLTGPPLVVVVGGLAAFAIAGHGPVDVGLACGLLVVSVVLSVGLRDFRRGGVLLLVTYLSFMALLVPWSLGFLAGLDVSVLTKALMLSALPVLLCFLPINLVRVYENWEVLCRHRWGRPRTPRPVRDGSRSPRASIHLPAHAEPPEVVIATLDSLSRLDYPNFEVVVVDNNTLDPALWRPVEQHCRALGERFRFFHVEGLTGAKAGALNFALRHTGSDAEVIALVDADYQVEPDWLAATVGYFEEPRMGFVQGPHAYRDHHHSIYLSMCNWEYAYYFATGLVSLNERNAAITVGTMSLIRRRALEEAGGWAEWCLTEDSELAVRLQALGYEGVYTTHVFGRGLIPQTFAGYRRQRFRWSYGPVQELRRHARLYFPGPWRRPSRLTVVQRIHHATHGLHNVSLGMELLAVPLAAAVLISMAAHHESVPLPFPLWLAWTVIFLGDQTLRFFTYRSVLGGRLRDAASAQLASSALMHVIRVASLLAAIGRPAAWHRTDKFGARSRGIAVLRTVPTEAALAGAYLILAAGTIVALRYSGFAMALAVGISFQALIYLAAPAMALLADRELRRLPASTDAPPLPATATDPTASANAIVSTTRASP